MVWDGLTCSWVCGLAMTYVPPPLPGYRSYTLRCVNIRGPGLRDQNMMPIEMPCISKRRWIPKIPLPFVGYVAIVRGCVEANTADSD